jgi:DNA-binding transcriptional LysR family regulator
MGNDWANDRLLKFMLAILQHEHFGRAAEHLKTSQSNLSDAAKQFLAHSGLRMYYLDKDHHVHANRTGIAFREMVPPLFDARDEVLDALGSIDRGEIRSLRLGCGTFVDPEAFRTACEIHKRFLPDCPIRPSHADTAQLVREAISGDIDAAMVTLPVDAAELRVQEIRRDRLVVCLRAGDPLARNGAVRPVELAGKPAVLYHPQQHPAAHARLLQMLAEKGVEIEDQCRASHPFEIQRLVLDGYGISLIREGTGLHPGLVTRPIAGVTWTVDTAFIYHGEHHPKTMPVLARELRKQLSPHAKKPPAKATIAASKDIAKRPPEPERSVPEQLSLPGLTVQ